MKIVQVESLSKIFRVLNDAKAEYLVVGGVAVVAHGHVRYTQDLDLVLGLSSPHLTSALLALKHLGFKSRLPVDVLEFADPEKRRVWSEEKEMMVFNLFSDDIVDVTIDIFPIKPSDFAAEYSRATLYTLAPNLEVPIVPIPALIDMKRKAGRPQDLIDVDKLGKIQGIADAKD